ncbi:MAG: helix-turn-helix transcriptional regulator [Clostridia bacterium]
MDKIKEIIKENLVFIRKTRKITQIELAEKINYSDKAISRWENGEVTPDVETLNKLSEIYNVPLTYFFEKHEKIDNLIQAKKYQIGNKLAITLLSILCIWFIVTLIFINLQSIAGINAWIVFVWAVPASCIVALVFNSIWGFRKWRFLIISLLIWTTLTAIYLQFLPSNLYLLFILGVPMQAATILWACMKPSPAKKDISN